MQELRHRMQDLERRLAERERDQRSPERSPTRSRSRSRSRRTPSPQYESESTGGRVRPRRRSRDPIIYARHERRRASNRGDEEAHRENDESRRTARGPVIIGATPFHRSDALEQAIRDGKLADFSHLIREPRRRNRDHDSEDRSRPTRRRQEPEGDDHGLTVVNVVTAKNTAPKSKSAQKKDAKVLAVSTSPVRNLKGLPPISFGPEDQWFDEGQCRPLCLDTCRHARDRSPAHVASPGRKGRSQTSGPEKEKNVAGKGGRGGQANGQPLRSGIHPGTGQLDLVVECSSG
ncbi:serine/arginine-rich splicing factor 11-like [Arachis ipaensis]|uniref:serine/arginine-rich splicing factor 11-like n=1 Tax=Arachis ipaensis TaxID=130454 RepID=UPI0007AF4A3B|nr:serine/arginine-rich splicing factor 11-like [Arachis ipaensis]